jgi:hypothetical protein
VDVGEELFWQIEGTVTVKLIEDGQPVDVTVGPGEMFLLPSRASLPASSAPAPPLPAIATERLVV